MNSIKPNFFIIGAAKAATTSLSSLLREHPQAAISKVKEPHFFSYDQLYRLGWRKYLELFSHAQGKKAIGDASTSYSRIRYHPMAVSRIHEHVPEAKIIYMVRHPLKRIESAFMEHLGTAGSEVFASINEAVQRQPRFVDSSRYWEVFDTYRQKFSESKIKIVWFEDYVANPTAVFQDVCRFLEIDDTIVPDSEKEHSNSRQNAANRMARRGLTGAQIDTVWQEPTRQRVLDQLREDNGRFLAYFGRPKNFWGELF